MGTLEIDDTEQADSGFHATINLKGNVAYAEFKNNDVQGYANMDGNITIDDWGAETSVRINLEGYGGICSTEIRPAMIDFTRLSAQSVDFRVQVIIAEETPADLEFSINVTGIARLSPNVRNLQLNPKIFIAKMESFHNYWLQYYPSNLSIKRGQSYKIEPTILNSGNSKDNYRLEVISESGNKNNPEITFKLERDYFEIPAFSTDSSYLHIIIGKETKTGEYKIVLRVTANKTDNKKNSLWVKDEFITVIVSEPEEYKRESGMFTVLMIGFIIAVVILTLFFLMIRALVRRIHKRFKRD